MAHAPTRHIIHADMDAFYASVEQRDNPDLRGQPVLVGGSPRARGVVAAASYEAREFGCRSAMPMKTAVRLCPHAQIVAPRFPRYREVSGHIMDVFRSVTPLVEPLSLDEAFLDITQRVQSGATPRETAEWIRARVWESTGLTVSCGVATSKSVAKIASDMDKPDGLTVVPSGTERAFLAPLPVRDLWGVGPKTAERLAQAGITTIGELAERPLPWLIERFGVRGEWFHRLALGEDDREVEVTRETKSVSTETTFAEDIGDLDALAEAVKEQARSVGRRLQRAGLRGRTVQIKLRLSDFTTFTRQRTLPAHTDSGDEIEAVALQLLAEQVGGGRRFRLVGVGASNLTAKETFGQLALFDQPAANEAGDPVDEPAGEEPAPSEAAPAPAPDAARPDAARPEAGDDSPAPPPPPPKRRTRPPPPRPARLHGAIAQVRDRYGEDAVHWGADGEDDD